MKDLIADVKGHEVHYIDFGGDGPPMVLAHGHGGSRFSWLASGPLFAKTHRALAADLPGFGDTRIHDSQDVTVEGQRQALEDFIATMFDDAVVLVGSSMGGMVSIHHAAEGRGDVRALALSDPAVPSLPEDRPEGSVAAVYVTFMMDDAEDQLEAQLALTTVEQAVRDGIESNYSDPGRAPREVVEAQIALAHRRREMPWANRALIEAGRSLINTYADEAAYFATIKRVQVPTLIVHGAQDKLVPLGAARRVADLRPDWKLEVIDDCGHVPHNEHPSLFVGIVEEWLRTLAQR